MQDAELAWLYEKLEEEASCNLNLTYEEQQYLLKLIEQEQIRRYS